MEFSTLVWLLLAAVAALAAAVVWLGFSANRVVRDAVAEAQGSGQAAMMANLNDATERLRGGLQALQLEQERNLSSNREALIRELASLTLQLTQKQDALKSEMLSGTLEKLAEQNRASLESIQSTMRLLTLQINERVDQLTKTNDARLADIGGKVNERLDEGFKKTNETFVNVMTRLATIDEAQKKIDGLTTNVVSLQQLLGDKRSRGALGERQLEDIIKNALPESVYEFQYTLSTKVRPDCVLKLPAPTGLLCIDAKFPLEAYERMFADGPERVSASVFKASVKKHIDDIAGKYILPGETGDGAVMFIPAESVFAEIHGNHRDLIDYAAARHVWLVSPTTLMAVLNTARVVLKDVETRKQVHIIQEELGKLAKDFSRFDERMSDLAKHIGQAQRDVEQVHISSRKISERFQKIEKAELAELAVPDQVVIPVDAEDADKPTSATLLSIVKPEN